MSPAGVLSLSNTGLTDLLEARFVRSIKDARTGTLTIHGTGTKALKKKQVKNLQRKTVVFLHLWLERTMVHSPTPDKCLERHPGHFVNQFLSVEAWDEA